MYHYYVSLNCEKYQKISGLVLKCSKGEFTKVKMQRCRQMQSVIPLKEPQNTGTGQDNTYTDIPSYSEGSNPAQITFTSFISAL